MSKKPVNKKYQSSGEIMAGKQDDFRKSSDEDVVHDSEDDDSEIEELEEELKRLKERRKKIPVKKTEENKSAVSNFLLKRVLPGAAVGVAAVFAAPLALTAVGFGAGGIAGGSMAAGMMSSAAIANGGGIAAGSLVAVLQSAGAAGISAAANVGIFSVVAGTTAVVVEGGSRVKDLIDDVTNEEKVSQRHQAM